MNISKDALRKETVAVLKQIDLQIAQIQSVAAARNIEPTQLRDERGNWPMIPLLQARALALNTLVLLQSK